MPFDPQLISDALSGQVRAVSRLMTIVERGGDDASSVLDALFPHVGNAYRIGVTGGTGSGKSSLVNELTRVVRAENLTIGVVAEDPTSPFTGGAVLGDRIRMEHAIGDPGAFVRSIASRGNETGLSREASYLADVLDASGRDIVILETIGVGQLEHRVGYDTDTTVVVFTPEGGDDVQGLKSGLMEVGDIFVVNKADRPAADRFAADLTEIVKLRRGASGWMPPVIPTRALEGTGVDSLWEAVGQHRAFLSKDGRLEARRKAAREGRLRFEIGRRLEAEFWGNPYIDQRFNVIFKEVAGGRLSPQRGARRLLDGIDVVPREGN